MRAVGEIEEFAKAASRFDRRQRLSAQRHVDLAIDQDGDLIACTFTLGDRPYRFAWTATGLDRIP